MQAEIEGRARIGGLELQRPGEGLAGGPGDDAVGFQGERLAQRRQGVRVVGMLGRLLLDGGDRLGRVVLTGRGGGRPLT